VLRLKTFGALMLTRDGHPAEESRIQRRQLAVLAVLASEGAAGVTRDRLLGLFWPDKEMEKARHLLDQAIYAARKEMGEDLILIGQTAVHLNAAMLPSDAADFAAAAAQHDDAALTAAYTGPFLDAVLLANAPEFERWASGRRSYYANAFVQALVRQAAARSAIGEYQDAAALLRRAAASDGLSGPVAYALMLALSFSGDPTAAIRAGTVHAALVREELEADPDPQVRDLMRNLRDGKLPVPPVAGRARESAAPAVLGPAPVPKSAKEPQSRPSVAVLPFVNLSSETDDDYLADAMTDAIINALMRVGTLRVAARTSVFFYKGKSGDVSEIGRQLGVGSVVEGSVLHAGTMLRVAAQIINVADGAHRWLGQFDREIRDLLLVLEEVARAVAQTLEISLLGAGVSPRTSVTTAAYERYLRGRYFGDRGGEESVQRALQYFREAVALEPAFAAAFAGEAEAHLRLAALGLVSPLEATARARELAEKARSMDPSLAEPRALLGRIAAVHDWNWSAAAVEFQRAIDLSPHYPAAPLWYAMSCLVPLRRLEEAQEQLRRARRLDPLSPAINNAHGTVLYLSGRYDEAIVQFRNVLDLEPRFAPAHTMLGLAELERGHIAAAMESLEHALVLNDGGPRAISTLALAHARAGDPDEAKGLLQRLLAMADKRYVSPLDPAVVHAATGDLDAAFRCFDAALDERSPDMITLALTPGIDALRSDVRFTKLLQRMGLQS
jgi:TolB-like protein/DNA-binding SARP family transcriptional activator/Tfp pilus assembly protein PilF